MSDWNLHTGTRCPVDSSTFVYTRYSFNGMVRRELASNVDWSRAVEYRVDDGTVPESTTVFVYGPKSVGKIRNAEALREFFGCTHIVENNDPTAVEPGALHLVDELPSVIPSTGCRVLPFQYAMQLMAVGKPQTTTTTGLPSAELCENCGRAGGEHDAVCVHSGDKGTAAERHLGAPALDRTDFKSWRRETLERFARQAADENLVLRERVFELEAKTLDKQ